MLLKVRLLIERHQRELRTEHEKVEVSRVEVCEAVREVAILKAKLGAIEGWRDHEIFALRTAGRDAVDNLKVADGPAPHVWHNVWTSGCAPIKTIRIW